MKPVAARLHRIADNLASGRLPNGDDAEAHAAALRRHLQDGTDLLRVVGLPDKIEYLPSLLNGVANLPLNLEGEETLLPPITLLDAPSPTAGADLDPGESVGRDDADDVGVVLPPSRPGTVLDADDARALLARR